VRAIFQIFSRKLTQFKYTRVIIDNGRPATSRPAFPLWRMFKHFCRYLLTEEAPCLHKFSDSDGQFYANDRLQASYTV